MHIPQSKIKTHNLSSIAVNIIVKYQKSNIISNIVLRVVVKTMFDYVYYLPCFENYIHVNLYEV